MTEQRTEKSCIESPLTVDGLLEAYAVTLQAYEDADKRFRAEPTIVNVSTMHRWLDRLVCIRDELYRSARLSDAISGAVIEPEIRKALEKLWAGKERAA